MASVPRPRGRPRHRGLHKGTPGASISGAKRTTVGKSLTKAGIDFEVGTSGLTVTKEAPMSGMAKRKKMKQTRRAAKKVMRKEKGMLSTAISMRHRKHLIDPDRPFAAAISDQERIASGLGLGSTAIVTFEYFEERRMLVLHWWKDWKKQIPGTKYAYFDVPIWKYDRLVRASSKGRYIYYNIRTSHPFKRLTK